jgi:hypothetical protein
MDDNSLGPSLLWMAETLTIAIQFAHDGLQPEAMADRVGNEVSAIYDRVKGNKASGARISVADKRLIAESTLRRAMEILSADAVPAAGGD